MSEPNNATSSGEEQQRENCAMGGCLEPPTKTLEIRVGDVSWTDDYCDPHADQQLETEDAEVIYEQ